MKIVAMPLIAVMALGFASVTRSGDQITYHDGIAHADEITIVGTANSGNIFQMAQRYAGMEYQLRFANGDFSYTVYASEGNPQVGAHAISGISALDER